MRDDGHGYVGTRECKEEEDEEFSPKKVPREWGKHPHRQGWEQIQPHCCLFLISLISFLPPSPALCLQWPLKLWPPGE